MGENDGKINLRLPKNLVDDIMKLYPRETTVSKVVREILYERLKEPQSNLQRLDSSIDNIVTGEKVSAEELSNYVHVRAKLQEAKE